MDEMTIRQYLEYDSTNYYGYIVLGNGLSSDSLKIAKECFMLMVVSINENWKLLSGYFLVSKLNSSRKAELVQHALSLLYDTGIEIISLTFDGYSSNTTVARLLTN